MRRLAILSIVAVALLLPSAASASPISDANFITLLYKDALNRTPSPSDISAGIVLLGSLTHQQFAALVLGSTEYQGDLVESYFQSYLSRTPTAPELSFSITLLGSSNDQTVQEDILGSAEFFSDHGGTDTGFVDALFMILLGRSPTLIEENTFVIQLGGGATRAQVAGEFLASPEYNHDLLASYFNDYLGRAPDSTESAFYLPLLEAGGNNETVQADILGGLEFDTLAQQTNGTGSSPTPEPSSGLLLGAGLLALGLALRRFAVS